MTIFEAKKHLEKELSQINCEHEARIMMCSVLDCSLAELILSYKKPMTSGDLELLNTWLTKRIHGEPLQYILGAWEFMDYEIYVDENVLIPRDDSVEVVRTACDLIKENKYNKVIDICTGSGCLAIALADLTCASVVGVDISEKAIEIAKKNADVNRVDIEFYKFDVFSDEFWEFFTTQNLDMLVSNPPYIRSCEIGGLAAEVRREPIIALDGGEDGLDFYREISLRAYDIMRNNSSIVFEIGYDQANEVSLILRKHTWRDINIIKDMNSNDRVVTARK